MTAAKDRVIYALELRPEARVIDPLRAVRKALKILLRDFGLRCITITSITMARKKRHRIPQHLLFEQMRVHAHRRAPRFSSWGWRPSHEDLRDLRESLKDARTYRSLAKGWRRAGFGLSAIMRLAGRTPADRNATIRHLAAAHMDTEKSS
jgi:hypothetical protein